VTGFDVWAPTQDRMRLVVDGATHEMTRAGDGWWTSGLTATHGTDYAYLIGDGDGDGDGGGDGGGPWPDPRSRWQPAGVHGPSRVYDHARFEWTDRAWTGRALPGAVIYETHLGTFTPEGTCDAAISRLNHLVDLGVDLIELLPVAAFNGPHNWGYDGVCWYAPHEGYGGPDALKRLVDACHARGLGVLLDVVHNHFGPSGAYAPMFAPYLAEAGANTWGRSLNLDGPHSGGVRRYVVDNALSWLADYHLDGLRLDAVHALVDHSATHLLEQLATEVDALAAHLGRPLALIAESDLNDARLVTAREAGGYGLTAQWDDDVHHALHARLTGERQGYYGDFGSSAGLAKVLSRAFFHDGTYSSFRGRVHGRPVDRARIPGYRFVAFLQDHDQIGNRATGDRLSATIGDDLLRVGAVLLLSAPYTVMLFMGEEWGARTPWRFFTSHPEPELGVAVGRGRRAEFDRHGWAGDVPDPQDPATFTASKLDWAEPDRPEHAAMLDFHRRLIALRKATPDLSDPRLDRVDVAHGPDHVLIRRGGTVIAANFGAEPLTLPADGGTILLSTDDANRLDGASVHLAPRSAVILGS
jgi:maltooligosyltrehalose trehalohydrolase